MLLTDVFVLRDFPVLVLIEVLDGFDHNDFFHVIHLLWMKEVSELLAGQIAIIVLVAQFSSCIIFYSIEQYTRF